ncbi:DUF4279 domain-containing protein [Paenimyroides baculatum]|uniref:DUF4279 domain-containing protein n=1 Tax=Paenimyroides baculatum TaxID=2608000 RepID=A0A5M6CL40_9FLAO|nr:DUF4279 domain-containing protein [Paenimyroides baculatum]KAA5534035.1 DUF4279 domain-containing protein [Paenimyroides baculatum]
MKTEGEIYFVIKTENPDIDIDIFNQYLSIKPTTFDKMFVKGIIPKCTSWIYSSGKLINADYSLEIEKLISKLIDRRKEFINLQNFYPEFQFSIQIVIYLGTDNPALHFNLNILNFLNNINTEIDCDIYNSLAK